MCDPSVLAATRTWTHHLCSGPLPSAPPLYPLPGTWNTFQTQRQNSSFSASLPDGQSHLCWLVGPPGRRGGIHYSLFRLKGYIAICIYSCIHCGWPQKSKCRNMEWHPGDWDWEYSPASAETRKFPYTLLSNWNVKKQNILVVRFF